MGKKDTFGWHQNQEYTKEELPIFPFLLVIRSLLLIASALAPLPQLTHGLMVSHVMTLGLLLVWVTFIWYRALKDGKNKVGKAIFKNPISEPRKKAALMSVFCYSTQCGIYPIAKKLCHESCLSPMLHLEVSLMGQMYCSNHFKSEPTLPMVSILERRKERHPKYRMKVFACFF